MIDFTAIGGVRASDPTQQGQAEIDKQTFLELLVTQLKNQDPFEPLKNEEFLAQLAQFSSLESLNNIYEEMGTANLLQNSVHNALSTSLIGNYGVTSGDTITLSGNDRNQLLYSMPERGDVVVTIRDASGTIVRTIEQNDMGRGDHLVGWDGRDENGDAVADGDYTVGVDIVSGASAGDSAAVYRVGRIAAVRFFGGNPVIVIDDKEYLLSDLLEVSESLPEGDAT